MSVISPKAVLIYIELRYIWIPIYGSILHCAMLRLCTREKQALCTKLIKSVVEIIFACAIFLGYLQVFALIVAWQPRSLSLPASLVRLGAALKQGFRKKTNGVPHQQLSHLVAEQN